VERLVLKLEERKLRPVTLIDYLFILKRFFKFVKYGNVDRERTPTPRRLPGSRRGSSPTKVGEPSFSPPTRSGE
jgi:hypothetical protein